MPNAGACRIAVIVRVTKACIIRHNSEAFWPARPCRKCCGGEYSIHPIHKHRGAAKRSTVRVLHRWIADHLKGAEHIFPSMRGGRLSADAAQHLVATHVAKARATCPSLARKRVTPHVFRHTAAMELLQAGVDRALIAIWLGHESVETTQVYLDANLALKEQILAKTRPLQSAVGVHRPGDKLLNFLKNLQRLLVGTCRM